MKFKRINKVKLVFQTNQNIKRSGGGWRKWLMNGESGDSSLLSVLLGPFRTAVHFVFYSNIGHSNLLLRTAITFSCYFIYVKDGSP